MKFKFMLAGLTLVCSSLLAVDGASAQQCRSQLINGSGVIVESFSGSECRTVREHCNRKLRRLQAQHPRFYRNAYCDVTAIRRHVSPRPVPHYQPQPYVAPHSQPQPYVTPYSRPQPYVTPYSQPQPYVAPRSRIPSHVSPGSRRNFQPVPQSRVTRSYDRCQAPGIVRCTQEWSDGRVVTEDHRCAGCRGYSNPSGDPCGWRCSFPQK
ncbi:MAG: hypothetical protein SD837_02815 [Candidatus Electrothrix scaldis]|nr:MAG: hypothetical protein SD837_02815 [Candidatus Electrothrix sp. GW3-3]